MIEKIIIRLSEWEIENLKNGIATCREDSVNGTPVSIEIFKEGSAALYNYYQEEGERV